MRLINEKVILRNMIESDIEDDIYWNTVETEWQKWDAPWEHENNPPFDAKKYREKELKFLEKLKNSPDKVRLNFEICINNHTETHIGSVNVYFIDEHYNWIKKNAIKGIKKCTLGIDICHTAAWHKDYGTAALKLFITHLLQQGFEEIYTQTWSGNKSMIALATKLGFHECHRTPHEFQVKGQPYDGLTFNLNLAHFNNL